MPCQLPEKSVETCLYQVAFLFVQSALPVQNSDFCSRILLKEIAKIRHLPMSVEKDDSLPELNRHTMIQYLLGELPPAWQEHFEEQFFTDKEHFAQLKLVEDQLVDDYVSQTLPESQRTRFETHYLNSDRRHQKLKFAQTLKQTLAEFVPASENQNQPSVWQSWKLAWQIPAIRYSFAAITIVVLVMGGWFMRTAFQLQKQRQQLEEERAALAQASATKATELFAQEEASQVAPQPSSTPFSSPSTSPSPTPSKSKDSANTILSLVLNPGTFRNEEATATRTLIVIPQTRWLHLKLPLNGQATYSAYRVVIETASGQTVWTRNDVHLGKTGPNNFIPLEIPAHSLPANDYLLTLSGKKENEWEDLEDYQFRVVKRS